MIFKVTAGVLLVLLLLPLLELLVLLVLLLLLLLLVLLVLTSRLHDLQGQARQGRHFQVLVQAGVPSPRCISNPRPYCEFLK